MKNIALALLVGLTLIFSGCGSNSNSGSTGNIDGTWSATLPNSSSANDFAFTTNLTVNGGGSLGTTNFSLTVNNTACSFPSSTETGSFGLTGNFNGQVSGTFHYVITSTGVEANILTLDGTVSGGKITGTWTVTGATANCTGNGTFTMTPTAASMAR